MAAELVGERVQRPDGGATSSSSSLLFRPVKLALHDGDGGRALTHPPTAAAFLADLQMDAEVILAIIPREELDAGSGSAQLICCMRLYGLSMPLQSLMNLTMR
ncbi:hypothetical protein E2562_023082, partial [Oryza meyeriana var. granulata]